MDLIFLNGVVFLLFEFVWCLGMWLVCEVSNISELPVLQWGGEVFFDWEVVYCGSVVVRF